MSRDMFVHWGIGSVSIGPIDMPELGKRPSLMVTEGNISRKVASFQSVEAARRFEWAMERLLGEQVQHV